jgi:hypothetical protein
MNVFFRIQEAQRVPVLSIQRQKPLFLQFNVQDSVSTTNPAPKYPDKQTGPELKR